MANSLFFVEGGADNRVNSLIREYQQHILTSLHEKGVDIAGFRIASLQGAESCNVKELILRQEPTIDEETLNKRVDEIVTTYWQKGRSRLLYINSTGYNPEGGFEADIICEEEFGSNEIEFYMIIDAFINAIASQKATQYTDRLCSIQYRLNNTDCVYDVLEEEDNRECLCNDLLAESIHEKHETEISPIMFDENFNISLPLYPQIKITLEPLPKTLYILFLHHPEGIVLKDIYMYENELKNIYSHVSGRKNPSVIKRILRSLTDPTDNPLHKNLSIIRKSFTSKLNYNIARNYIPAHGRTKAHNIPLESEYVILPDIA